MFSTVHIPGILEKYKQYFFFAANRRHYYNGNKIWTFLIILSFYRLWNRDKKFVSATPLPGTIIVNIADLMQRWTADKFVSTVNKT